MQLADGSRWSFLPDNTEASLVISEFARIAQLSHEPQPTHRLFIRIELEPPDRTTNTILCDWTLRSDKSMNKIACVLYPQKDSKTCIPQFIRMSMAIGLHTQRNGGLLLHGALAEWQGKGIILTGPSGIGKTTASQRLKPPWSSLSDDQSLVVRNSNGQYWAHPWPTWSYLASVDPQKTWNVQQALPLHAICLLTQAATDHIELLGTGASACLLTESVEQIWWERPKGSDASTRHSDRLQRFKNICAFVQHVPCYLLQLSQTGAFWRKIEGILAPTNPANGAANAT